MSSREDNRERRRMVNGTEERRETLAHLVEAVGFTVEEAERVMRDDDLWLLEPGLRLEVPDEEAVEQWRTADDTLEALIHVADNVNLATMVAIMDARCRVEVALRRTKERVRQAQEEA
jgi:hypothetical protein